MVITQMWMTHAAPQAHSFATSLYVSAANAGIALGSWIGGVFINAYGLPGILWCGLMFAGLSLVAIVTGAVLDRARSDTGQTLALAR
jgi:predicted MFS family arabinose efflux permease